MTSPFPTQFRDNFYGLCPPLLRDGNGEAYLYTSEVLRDWLIEKAYQGVTFRLPGLGDVSQIPYLAHDRQLAQGPAEPLASFVQRLIGSFASWAKAGSRVAVAEQLQAYLQNLQPGVTETLPEIIIVGGSYPTVNTWDVTYLDTPSIALDGGVPAKTTVMPGGAGVSNFDWDGKSSPWRSWLILPMAQVPTGQSGSAAETGTAQASACFTSPGQNVSGVWVPATSGAPVNSPWLTITGLAGLDAANLNQWLTLSGSVNAGNNGTFPIVTILSDTSVVIANPNGVAADSGPLTWSIGAYPFIGPGLVWGTPGSTFGAGELSTPPLDTGSNVGGVWQPTLGGNEPLTSWGLTVSADTIISLREIVRSRKSAGSWYVNLIVAFDCGTGVAGDAYSPLSTPGSGNPDGTFGNVGKLSAGVWVPTRLISNPFDCYCSGTESYSACLVANVT